MRDFVFATAIYESGDWESAELLPANIIDSVARYTSIRVAPKGVNVPLATEQLFEHPLVWLTGHLPVRFTDLERRHLALYVERGGLIVIDDHNHDIDGVFHKTATQELSRAFGPKSLIKLPNTHELYKCFFEFKNGPPATSHELNGDATPPMTRRTWSSWRKKSFVSLRGGNVMFDVTPAPYIERAPLTSSVVSASRFPRIEFISAFMLWPCSSG